MSPYRLIWMHSTWNVWQCNLFAKIQSNFKLKQLWHELLNDLNKDLDTWVCGYELLICFPVYSKTMHGVYITIMHLLTHRCFEIFYQENTIINRHITGLGPLWPSRSLNRADPRQDKDLSLLGVWIHCNTFVLKEIKNSHLYCC